MDELKNLAENMDIAIKEFPKMGDKFIRKQRNKAKRIMRRIARERIKRQTGNYLRGIDSGRVYKLKVGGSAANVYNNAPHAFLIEHGHRVVRGGKEVGFAKGFNIVRDTKTKLYDEIDVDLDKEVDEFLNKELFT